MPVIQVGVLVVGLDGSSPTGLPLHLAFALALCGLAIFPPAWLVLVIRMVLLVLHPQSLCLFDKGPLVTFVQQPAEAKAIEKRGRRETGTSEKKTLYTASWDVLCKYRCQGTAPLRVFPEQGELERVSVETAMFSSSSLSPDTGCCQCWVPLPHLCDVLDLNKFITLSYILVSALTAKHSLS